MDRKIYSIVLGAALVVGFFLPLASGGAGQSAFEIVKAPSYGVSEFDFILFKYLWIIFPLSGVMLLVGALNNENYILGRGLWVILPLLTFLYYTFGWQLINGAKIGDVFKSFGKQWGIAMWLFLVVSLAAVFYHPKAKA